MTERSKQTFWLRLRKAWKENPLVSTVMVLLLMIILQTLTISFNIDVAKIFSGETWIESKGFADFNAWFTNFYKNWINLLRNNATVGIVALGMTLVIISGGIDLAVGSTLVAVGAIMMVLVNENADGVLTKLGISGVPAFVIAIAAGLLVGAAIGGINGALIAKSKLPAFIATLGTMKIARSVTQHCMQAVGVKVPSAFMQISRVKIGGQIIMPIIYWAVLAAVLYVIAKHTPFGRQIYAIGSNEKTARLSGIHVELVKMLVYVIMGVLVAISAVINISYLGSMDYANAGSGYEMDAIAAVVVGGTSMSGGKGSIIGTVFGMLIMAVMNNLLNLLGVPPFLCQAFKGFIVILAVLLQKKETV